MFYELKIRRNYVENINDYSNHVQVPDEKGFKLQNA